MNKQHNLQAHATFAPKALFLALGCLFVNNAMAEEATQSEAKTIELTTISVTGNPLGLGADALVVPVSTLNGRELSLRRESTLGDTLNGIPGVSATPVSYTHLDVYKRQQYACHDDWASSHRFYWHNSPIINIRFFTRIHMQEDQQNPCTQAQNHAISADQVTSYLRSYPHFFEQHASLLTEIYLPSPHGTGAISLAERQQLAQRDKIRVLEAKLDKMCIRDRL